MLIIVKTLKGTQFEINANPGDTVADVKNNIEASQGQNVYPAERQILIHQGKILKDATTLAENGICDGDFVVIMLSKPSTGGSSSAMAPAPTTQPPPVVFAPPAPSPAPSQIHTPALAIMPVATPTTQAEPAVQASAEAALTEVDKHGQAATNLVAGSSFEERIQRILDIGGGTWDRDTIVRALRAAFNNPDRAIEYLCSGIPEQQEAPRVVEARLSQQPPTQLSQDSQRAVPSGSPNANPLNLFPQGLPNVGSNAGGTNLDLLRNSLQLRGLHALLQANPDILQPMLQELRRRNPQLLRLLQERQSNFVGSSNERVEGAEANFVGSSNERVEGAEGTNRVDQQGSPTQQEIQLTPEEQLAVGRLEGMGFDRRLVLEIYFACNKNEELAANYLLDHANDFDN